MILLLMDFIIVLSCYYYYSYIQHIESMNTGKWQYYTYEEVTTGRVITVRERSRLARNMTVINKMTRRMPQRIFVSLKALSRLAWYCSFCPTI